jgi:hypothetical protein
MVDEAALGRASMTVGITGGTRVPSSRFGSTSNLTVAGGVGLGWALALVRLPRATKPPLTVTAELNPGSTTCQGLSLAPETITALMFTGFWDVPVKYIEGDSGATAAWFWPGIWPEIRKRPSGAGHMVRVSTCVGSGNQSWAGVITMSL